MIETGPDAARAVARRKATLRLFACEGDPTSRGYGEAFMRTYFPHYATRRDGSFIPAAEWHGDFDRQVYGSLGSGVRKVFLAPRGYAKSTKVSLVTPLICLARNLKRYILLVQETGPQAKQAMSQIIAELDSNEMLLADFPHLARKMVKGRPVADRDDDIVFANDARLQALGAGGSLRGRRNREQRPDLVLIDDLEDDEHVRTRYQRDKLDEWLSSALLGALVPESDVYYVGTLLHHDAVLARVMKRGAPWQSFTYEAITDRGAFDALVKQAEQAIEDLVDAGEMQRGEWDDEKIEARVDQETLAVAQAASTWPQHWGAMALVKKRKEMGSAAFSRELLHEPVDDSDKLFPREHFQWRDMRRRLLTAEAYEFKSPRLLIVVDPAIGEKKTNDYSAVGVCAKVEPATYDVLDVWQGRVSQKQLGARIFATFELWRRYHPVILSESVQAQAWLAQHLRDEYILVVKELIPLRDKELRAAPVSVLYENHQVWHDESLRDGDFELQLTQFPLAENDDMVDCVVYGLTDLSARVTPRATRL
jgi:phage terminase large subunit-like protein